jgi:hypothetical protein
MKVTKTAIDLLNMDQQPLKPMLPVLKMACAAMDAASAAKVEWPEPEAREFLKQLGEILKRLRAKLDNPPKRFRA